MCWLDHTDDSVFPVRLANILGTVLHHVQFVTPFRNWFLGPCCC